MKFLLSFLFLCLIAYPALAQDGFDRSMIEKQLTEQKAAIEKIEMTLNEETLTQEKILELRQSLRASRDVVQNEMPLIY